MRDPEVQSEIQYLRRAVEELAFLNDLSTAIGSSFNSREIMQTIIKMSIRAVNAEQGAIILVSVDADSPAKTLVRSMVSSTEHEPFSLNQNLIGWMHINKKPLNITDPANDTRFSGIAWDNSIRSVACTPLMIKAGLTGILCVFNKKARDCFVEDDVRLLSIVAGQSAQVIENARLYEEEQALLKMREEARLAAEIQRNLLPDADPGIDGYDIAGRSIPALSVGGDYYDFIPISSSELAVCLGDISGKGMPAALLMSNLQATIRGQVLAGLPPRECIRRSNTLLYRSTEPNRFATFFYGVLDYDKHELAFTNAGQDPPLLFRGSEAVTSLKSGGPALGFVDGLDYLEEALPLESGDVIVFYTDGVTEAMDKNENEFGKEQLEKLLRENLQLSARNIIDKVIDTVMHHSREVPQSDDITMIVVRRE